MNIFITNPSPVISAYNIDDVRGNKMIVESCQMIGTRLYMCIDKLQSRYPLSWIKANKENKQQYKEETGLYVPCYIDVPCNIWIRKNNYNFAWLVAHTKALADLYYLRTQKQHASMKIFNSPYFPSDFICYHPYDKLSPLPNCTPFCKSIDGKKQYFTESQEKVIRDYKKFMIQKWCKTDKIKLTWERRNITFDYPRFMSEKAIKLMKDRQAILGY